MTPKTKILIVVVYTAVAVAVGRYTLPERVKTETKIVEVEKKTENIDFNKNTHKETKSVVVERPNGEKETTTIVVEDTNKDLKKNTTDDISIAKTESKEVERGTSKVTLSLLAGVPLNSLTSGPTYGISVTKPILGPITVGAFAFTDSRAGLSIGLTF